MNDTLTVELVSPRRRPASADEIADRTSTVGRLAALGLVEDPASGEVNTQVTEGWVARVGGLELPLFSYSVEPLDDGRVLVALMVAADEVTVVGSSAGGKPIRLPAAAPGGPVGTVGPDGTVKRPATPWGAPGPDPREGIPGWKRADDGDQADATGGRA